MRHLLAPLVLLCSLTAPAQDKGFGLGIIVGEPTGISMKGWIDDNKAIDGAIAWSLRYGSAFHLHGDLLFHKPDLIKVGKGRLPLYYGPGVRMRLWNDGRYWKKGRWYYEDRTSRVDLAIRFPVGLAYWFEGAPVDVFLEVVPTLDLTPSTWFEVDAAIGGRYWF